MLIGTCLVAVVVVVVVVVFSCQMRSTMSSGKREQSALAQASMTSSTRRRDFSRAPAAVTLWYARLFVFICLCFIKPPQASVLSTNAITQFTVIAVQSDAGARPIIRKPENYK